MPELPEVESARRTIADAALHRRIVDVDDSDSWECRPFRPGEIRAALMGRELVAAHRRGKSLWIPTSDDGPDLGIHLGMSGRIVVEDPGGAVVEGGDRPGSSARKDEWYRFALDFEDGGRLRLLDVRRLGRVRLDPDIDALGPDAGEIDRDAFRRRIGRGTIALKARLLDQSAIAGVGNLLADEVLWEARLDPRRPVGGLTEAELDGLRRHLRSAIRAAIRLGGVHTGAFIPHRTRDGHCPRCGAEVARGTVGGRTTYWCPREQH